MIKVNLFNSPIFKNPSMEALFRRSRLFSASPMFAVFFKRGQIALRCDPSLLALIREVETSLASQIFRRGFEAAELTSDKIDWLITRVLELRLYNCWQKDILGGEKGYSDIKTLNFKWAPNIPSQEQSAEELFAVNLLVSDLIDLIRQTGPKIKIIELDSLLDEALKFADLNELVCSREYRREAAQELMARLKEIGTATIEKLEKKHGLVQKVLFDPVRPAVKQVALALNTPERQAEVGKRIREAMVEKYQAAFGINISEQVDFLCGQIAQSASVEQGLAFLAQHKGQGPISAAGEIEDASLLDIGIFSLLSRIKPPSLEVELVSFSGAAFIKTSHRQLIKYREDILSLFEAIAVSLTIEAPEIGKMFSFCAESALTLFEEEQAFRGLFDVRPVCCSYNPRLSYFVRAGKSWFCRGLDRLERAPINWESLAVSTFWESSKGEMVGDSELISLMGSLQNAPAFLSSNRGGTWQLVFTESGIQFYDPSSGRQEFVRYEDDFRKWLVIRLRSKFRHQAASMMKADIFGQKYGDIGRKILRVMIPLLEAQAGGNVPLCDQLRLRAAQRFGIKEKISFESRLAVLEWKGITELFDKLPAALVRRLSGIVKTANSRYRNRIDFSRVLMAETKKDPLWGRNSRQYGFFYVEHGVLHLNYLFSAALRARGKSSWTRTTEQIIYFQFACALWDTLSKSERERYISFLTYKNDTFAKKNFAEDLLSYSRIGSASQLRPEIEEFFDSLAQVPKQLMPAR